MIKFFRRIRQKLLTENRFSKYLLYAIGEIVLVVIGILIALQINNWNETRQEIKIERELLTGVLESIRTDSISLDSMITRSHNILQVHKNLIAYSEGKMESSDVGNLDAFRRSEPNQLVTKKNYPNLSAEVRDIHVKKKILDYYLSVDWLESTIHYSNEMVEQKVRPFLGEKNLLNYGNQFNPIGDNMQLVSPDRFFLEFQNEPLKQVLFESGNKLRIMMENAGRTLQKNEEVKATLLNYLKKS